MAEETSRLICISQRQKGVEMLVAAMSVFERRISGVLVCYIEKIDTSGYGVKHQSGGQAFSVASSLVLGYSEFLQHLSSSAEQLVVSLHVFSRSQPQYLFANSACVPDKLLLDDVKLIKWWARVLAIAHETLPNPRLSSLECHWVVPGDSESMWKRTLHGWKWGLGFPDEALAHKVIPRLPDDPKTRLLQGPAAPGGLTVAEFIELLSISEECGAGRRSAIFTMRWVLAPAQQIIPPPDPANGYEKVNRFMMLEADFRDFDAAKQSSLKFNKIAANLGTGKITVAVSSDVTARKEKREIKEPQVRVLVARKKLRA